jgi:glutamate-ammonia-ligase adenylyltransferase
LLANAGNIALLERAQALGLLPDDMGHLAARAYRTLRQVQHQARLDEAPAHVPMQELLTERAAILALWQYVFAPGA